MITFSCRRLLMIIQIIVCLAWMNQLAFHQTWLCLAGNPLSWKNGFILSILVSLIPLFCFRGGILPFLSKQKTHHSSPIFCSIDSQDIKIVFALLALGIFCWWFFSKGAVSFPMHIRGDESFHWHRVEIMAQDFYTWIRYIFIPHTNHPEFPAEYMFYPAIGYVPITVLTSIFGDTSSIADQRIWLVIYYLATIFATYLLARTLITSRLISTLITLLPLTSPLLLTYTTSFYMELPYVSVFLFSFWLLAWGIKNSSKELIIAAVLVSSIAPIIREPALAGTVGIIFAAILWQFHQITLQINTKSKIKKIFEIQIHLLIASIKYLILGLLPFIAYYMAKSNYTHWDKERTSLSFIFQQDYLSLFNYHFLYLGLFAIIALVFCVFFYLQLKKEHYLILAAFTGIIGGIFTESIFLPYYMPWSRNYLFFYAQFTVLIIVFFSYLYNKWPNKKKIIISLLLTGIIFNLGLSVFYLQDADLYHESETVFDLRPISSYIEKHPKKFNHQKIYIAWPSGFPNYPDKQLPPIIELKKISFSFPQTEFLEFSVIDKSLSVETHYLLFYYLKNESKPKAFYSYPAVLRPIPNELEGYRILVESIGPWSNGKNGVILLEKSIKKIQ